MTMFQNRHYETIATLMQEMHPGAPSEFGDGVENPVDFEERLEMWNDFQSAFERLFAIDNRLFKPDRFCNACHPGADVFAQFGLQQGYDIEETF